MREAERKAARRKAELQATLAAEVRQLERIGTTHGVSAYATRLLLHFMPAW